MVLAANPNTATPHPAGWASHLLCSPGGYDLERVRFFPRQLIKADDLTQDQAYHRAKMKRHNRFLHGWGVVCGGEVTATASDWTVCVAPAYVLGPEGDEILIDCCVEVDLSREDLDGNATVCGAASDPWCSSVRVDRPVGQTLYLAVAYAEHVARPVHVQPVACSCDGSECEYSRVRDGYVIKILDRLPKSYEQRDPVSRPFECPHGSVRQCPVCPTEPWVILAAITVRARQLSPADIDNSTYRRYVASFAEWWFRCAEEKPQKIVVRQLVDVRDGEIQPDLAVSIERGDRDTSVTFKLEEDIELSDGRPFDAKAARDALEAHREALARVDYLDAETVERLVLKVKLDGPITPRFFAAIARVDYEVKAKA